MRSRGAAQAGDAPRLSRPMLYSLLVHVALLAALIFGVDWRNDEPQSVAVELWDAFPGQPAASPAPPEPKPAPRPEPKPSPPKAEPESKPAPARKAEARPEPPKKAREQPARKEQLREDAEIRRKADAKREAVAKREALKREQEKKREQQKKLDAERERKLAENQREQKERDAVRQRKFDEERTAKAQRDRDEAAAMLKLRSAQEQKALAAARAGQQRASNQAVINEYKRKIRNKILANVITPPDLSGNPEAVFEVVLLPGGDVLNARLSKPSGNPAWDSAVERAIHKSQPLPLPADPELFSQFRELNLRFKPN